MFNDIKITINGDLIDLSDIIEDNEGKPIDAQDILEKVKYELESIAMQTFDDIIIRKVIL
tara:strand:- start:4931 stop:5110 length:180 start_codon:yes stop_codon:yes gene_type:complete